MTDRRSHRTPRSAAGCLRRIIKQLTNRLMNTPRGLFLAAACCVWFGSACFVLAYDYTTRADHPAWFRFGAVVLCLWWGVTGLRQGQRLWKRRSVLKRTGT
jgi:hypothetical protein